MDTKHTKHSPALHVRFGGSASGRCGLPACDRKIRGEQESPMDTTTSGHTHEWRLLYSRWACVVAGCHLPVNDD